MNFPLRGRLLASIGLPVLLISFLIPGGSFLRLAAEERAETLERLGGEAARVAERFDAFFARAATEASGNARAIESEPGMAGDRILQLLRSTVVGAPGIYGAALAFEPGVRGTEASLVAPYVHRFGEGLAEMNIDASVYDWYRDERWTWWHGPRNAGAGVWTEPYLDEGAGGVMMVTYGEPVIGVDAAFLGVATVDVALSDLATRLADRLAGSRDFIILAADGRLIAARREGAVLGRNLAEVAGDEGWASLRTLAETISEGGSGIGRITTPDLPGPQLVGFAPIGTTGWSFAFRVPEEEALASVRRHAIELAAGLLLTLALILGVTWFMAGRVVRPVLRLRDGVAAVAGGDLDAYVGGVERRDEIGQLAVAFNGMTGTLQETLERLTREQADRARIERDLDLAREIQRGLLPREALDLDGFTVAGWNQPADKTGGDYYDWLPMPDGRALVVLADVTGHGIGPALIVAACRAYVRAAAHLRAESLTETLTHVNRLLCQDVGEGRFVTAAVGLIDPAAGQLHLLSAGQAPILFVHGASGEVESWPAQTIPLGILDPLPDGGIRTIPFQSGDQLVLLTDGFMEWANAARELFGTHRLADSLREHRGLPPAVQIARLHEAVMQFAGGTPQADDLTAVIIRRD